VDIRVLYRATNGAGVRSGQTAPLTNGTASHGYARLRRAIVGGLALVTAIFLGVIAFSVWQGYEHAIQEAERKTASLAWTIDEHAKRTLSGVDATMIDVVDDVQSGADTRVFRSPTFDHVLETKLKALAQMRVIVVTDANADTVATGTPGARHPNVADREYFKVQRDDPDRGFFIGKPIKSRVDGRWILVVSRRISARDGSFAGTVASGVDPEFFNAFYRNIEIGADSLVLVMHPDQAPLVREPLTDDAFLTAKRDIPGLDVPTPGMPVATLIATSDVDGVKRIVSLRHMKDFPLIVAVGVSYTEALAPWRHDAWVNGTTAAGFVLVAGILAFLLLRNLHRLQVTAEDLRQSEQERQSIFEKAVEGIYRSSVEGRWLMANPAFVRMHGYGSEAEFLAAVNDIATEYYVDPTLRRRIGRMLDEQGEIVNFESEVYRHKTKEKFWTSENSHVIRDEAGKIVAYEGTVLDVSERRRQEAALAETSARLSATFENMGEGLILVDAQFRLVAWNRRFLEIQEIPDHVVYPGVPYETVFRYLVERGDLGAVDVEQRVRERMEEVLKFEPGQFEHTRPNGTVVDIRVQPLPEGGFVSTYIDITARKQAEAARLEAVGRAQQAQARLIDAIESVSEAFVLYDSHERFVVCNNRYREFYPDTADLHVPGTTYENLLRAAVARGQFVLPPGEDLEAYIQDRLAKFRNPGEPIVRQLSSGRWVLINERRTRAGDLVSVRTDITAFKENEQALMQAKEQAEAANRAKSEFLANISHELRTPLHAILGLADVIRDPSQGATESIKQYVGVIHDSGRHLLDLIGDILDMAKIESGRHELADEIVDMGEAVDACMILVSERALKGEVTVEKRIASPLPMMRGDRRAVKQIAINLLSNAVKFTPAGGRVEVEAARRLDGGLSLRVIDTGVGMAPADIGRATEPFWQADRGNTRRYEGTGLGLAICKRFVEMHGGELRIESALGHGTTVTVDFPSDRTLGR
jgi:PAS domain S-box-containing protein